MSPRVSREERRAYERARYAANREKEQARYAANREKERARTRAYRAANREKLKAYARAYRAANREKERARAQAYRAANREKVQARRRAYYVANRAATLGRNRESSRERRTGLTGITFQRLLAGQEGLCAIHNCGTSNGGRTAAGGERALFVDHDHDSGLIRGLLCGRHNRLLEKGLTIKELLALADYLTNPPARGLIGEVCAPGRQSSRRTMGDGQLQLWEEPA